MKITVIGIGPGGADGMTLAARAALAACDVIAGYDLYVELIRPLIGNKEVIATGMRQEAQRCNLALQAALSGKIVGLVCSGDAGIYGMAGIMYEVAAAHPEVAIEVIPGVTAACSAAAVLGAPLVHDFAVISLSDLLTPWDKIALRLDMAAATDFVICLYNPKSKKRVTQLEQAVNIMLKHKDAVTPCGYVKNIGRPGETAYICTLGDLPQADIDMLTTVIVGNSQTRIINGKLVTPRGYKNL